MTTKPEMRAGRRTRKGRERLALRQKLYAATLAQPQSDVVRSLGERAFHKPGSVKK